MKLKSLQLRLNEDENVDELRREARSVLKCNNFMITFLNNNALQVSILFEPIDEMKIDCFVQMMEDQFDTLKRVK